MGQVIARSFDGGLVTARDASTLRENELTLAEGCEYRVGSEHIYKLNGRASTGTALGAQVRGIHVFQYDSATDKLVATSGTQIWESAVSTAPVFASALAGLTDTGVPMVAAMQDFWIWVNGIDDNRIRESGNVPGTASPWRLLGMEAPNIAPTFSVTGTSGGTTLATSLSGNYALPANAVDGSDVTYAYGSVFRTQTLQHIWNWTTNLAVTGRQLQVTHEGYTSNAGEQPGNVKRDPDVIQDTDFTVTLEYSTNAGTSWTAFYSQFGRFGKITTTIPIDDALNMTNLQFRATTQHFSGASSSHKVYEIVVKSGGTIAYDITNGIVYGFTELYIDSAGVEHESNMSPASLAVSGTTIYTVTLTIPARTNTFTVSYAIYRSVDVAGGGYPTMYRIDTYPASDVAVTWKDTFGVPPTSTATILYPMISINYADGTTLPFPINTRPPAAKSVIPFQGSMVYLPSSDGLSRRLYYSVSNSISTRGIEQVPSIYYLEFVTQYNDSIKAISLVNSGKTLLAYFERYTMLVNYLPQATDSGIFDNRIKEYVSNSRGAAGVRAVCEFTIPSGQTNVAAVDSMGLWVTNGIEFVEDWSRDLDWPTLMSGVDLSTAMLVDNPVKYRIEMLYTSSAGVRQELHFFYGRAKTGSDGRSGPLITGPHRINEACRTWGICNNTWTGWGGDSSATGDVFVENTQAADDSHAYDGSGSVLFDVTTGEVYAGGFGRAHIVDMMYPKFVPSVSKNVTVTATFKRDGSSTEVTKAKTFTTTNKKKLYFHKYADRHKMRITDSSNTALPALIGYEIDLRDAGIGRDK